MMTLDESHSIQTTNSYTHVHVHVHTVYVRAYCMLHRYTFKI